MTIVVVQCRLSSSRLPRKALLPLAGRPLLAWTLAAMGQVPADHHILAVDHESVQELEPIAKDCGWDIFAGDRDDVLGRFCAVAAQYGCVGPTDMILRATADNPFLFHEAAVQLLEEMRRSPCDYLTYVGLPHGSGVEVLNARSLLEARRLSEDPYDHEHVGPALYRHPQDFVSVMLPAPDRWNHPDLRTTVDTASDYRRCLRIVRCLSESRWPAKPFGSGEILSALADSSVARPVLCVPAVERSRGTGHLRRCLDIAGKLGADILAPNLDSASSSLSVQAMELLRHALEEGLEDWRLRSDLPGPGEYSLILADCFSLDRERARALSLAAPLAAIDEGSSHTTYCDYLLDIIPSHKLGRVPNLRDSSLIPLPKNRRKPAWCPEDGKPVDSGWGTRFSKILVSTGGEDPAGLAIPAALALAALGKEVTVIVPNPADSRQLAGDRLRGCIRVVPPVSNLREKLHHYDVVVTHYGFTAFESLAAGCGVILLGTSALHLALGQRYGFASISKDALVPGSFSELLEKPWLLYPRMTGGAVPTKDGDGSGPGEEGLEDFVRRLAAGSRIFCPVCGGHTSLPHQVIARTSRRTFRRCGGCGIIYMGWSCGDELPSYSSDYFFEDYKSQYGKTYLEDFDSIKSQGVRRMSIIDALFWFRRGRSAGARRHHGHIPSVLDIGCAYGPFLAAGADAGWQVFGTDISRAAVEHVQSTLKFPAVCAAFPSFNPVQEFGIGQFDAITMWYVIEHFRSLAPVLQAVSRLLKVGGVFAFSTPSASGVSARLSPETFFASSPADHFTLWEPRRAAGILRRFGFKLERIVSTGHHPERFPLPWGTKKNAGGTAGEEGGASSAPIRPGTLLYSTLHGVSRCLGLGDTFEVYCTKTEDIE